MVVVDAFRHVSVAGEGDNDYCRDDDSDDRNDGIGPDGDVKMMLEM